MRKSNLMFLSAMIIAALMAFPRPAQAAGKFSQFCFNFLSWDLPTLQGDRKNILVINPRATERVEFKNIDRTGKYNFLYLGKDFLRDPRSWPGLADINQYVDRIVDSYKSSKIDGVIGIQDYPAALIAAAVAEKLGLPGPKTKVMLELSHKFASRELQNNVVPDAVPRYQLLDPFNLRQEDVKLSYPFFVKPVKASASVRAGVVHNFTELKQALHFSKIEELGFSAIMRPFGQLSKTFGGPSVPARDFIAEELIVGPQVTVDGYVSKKGVTVLGVVDSIMYPGTNSFARFQYPSALGPDVVARMEKTAQDVMEASGLQNNIFNIEMFYDPVHDHVFIIEINPRMSEQFADLYEKVLGTNLYSIQTALALGEEPVISPSAGKYGVSASYVLRTFPGQQLSGSVTRQKLDAVRAKYPDARLNVTPTGWTHSLNLSLNDRDSVKLGTINIGADDQAGLEKKYEDIKRDLGIAIINGK